MQTRQPLRIVLLGTLLVTNSMCGAEFAQSDAVAEGRRFRVGLAAVDITPAMPIRLRGYSGRTTEATEVTQRLGARALAAEDRSTEDGPAVLVTIENCIIPDALVRRVATRLMKEHGLPRERLTITASHTHNGPVLAGMSETLYVHPLPAEQLARIETYTRSLENKIVQVALAALDDRRPSLLSWGTGKAGFAHNRRTKGGPVDHDLPVLVVRSLEDDTGKPDAVRAVYISYACHCTTLSHNRVSGDWAGHARESIEAAFPGAVALVSAGCGGDQNPARDGKVKAESQDELAARHGREIGGEVKRMVGAGLRAIDGSLAVSFATLELPLAKPPTRAEFERRAKESDQAGTPGYHARVQLARLDRGEALRTHVPYPVQTWRFADDLSVVYLGGEVVVDYSTRLKTELGRERLWINAYSNDVACYIPSDRVLAEGGYEGGGAMIFHDWPAPFAPGIEQLIVDEVHRQVRTVPLSPDDFESVALPPFEIDGKIADAHTQGLVVDGDRVFVTARRDDVRPRRALLLTTRLSSRRWERIVDVTPTADDLPTGTQGVLDHPGGFDSDGTHLWIPLSHSRRDGRSLIRAYSIESVLRGDEAPVEATRSFSVEDHIGAIAVSRERRELWGASWDTNTVYVWSLDGKLLRSFPRDKLVPGRPGWRHAVQDWKIDGLLLFAGGLDKRPSRPRGHRRSVVQVIDLATRKLFREARLPHHPDAGELTREGMAIHDGKIWLLPADLGARNRMLRIDAVQLLGRFPRSDGGK